MDFLLLFLKKIAFENFFNTLLERITKKIQCPLSYNAYKICINYENISNIYDFQKLKTDVSKFSLTTIIGLLLSCEPNRNPKETAQFAIETSEQFLNALYVEPHYRYNENQMRSKDLSFVNYVGISNYIHLDNYKYLTKSIKPYRNRKFVLFCPGFTIDPLNSSTINDLLSAFKTRKDVLFMSLDTGNYLGDENARNTVLKQWSFRDMTLKTINDIMWLAFSYKQATENVEKVGELVARVLDNLIKMNVLRINNIHIIGHSLGAHVAGAIGYHFERKHGKKLPHITGLDPANPLFSGSKGLNYLNADFVDAIYTNPGFLGKANVVGHANFYANGASLKQPGCKKDAACQCSHSRACVYYAETVYSECSKSIMANEIYNTAIGFNVNKNRYGNFSFNVKPTFKKTFGTFASAACAQEKQMTSLYPWH